MVERNKVDHIMRQLLKSSLDHRQALLNALVEMPIPFEITPQGFVGFFNTERSLAIITFGDIDLPI